MHFPFLASKRAEYRALRAQSQGWAQIWQLGHGIFWMCVLSLPGVVAAWWVSRDEPEPHHNVVWSLIAPVLVFAAVGAALKRYAVRKGRAAGATSG